jgi:hypothetical protein
MVNFKNKTEFDFFQAEMARLSAIKYTSYVKTMKEIGISYIAKCNCSTKLMHNQQYNMLTYGLYLASSDASGINVCPNSDMCREACLVGSGYAKIDALAGNNRTLRSRIIKTRLFFANRPLFMKLMIMEINRGINEAKRKGFDFSIRLNCTSDISPVAFTLNGKNILDMYPNVSFYDYTKNKNRWKLLNRYPNYYVTFSRDGSAENEKECLEYLKMGGTVAVVFGVLKKTDLPKKWKGYDVLCGDDYDYRPWDKVTGKQIVGLYYKVGKNDFDVKNGIHHFKGVPNIPFIIQADDADCEWDT